MYIVSACLTGACCKYNGRKNTCSWVAAFVRSHSCALVCPENLGGLKIPRPPAEITDGRAYDKDGKDVTYELTTGAEAAYEMARAAAAEINEEFEGAILKANSPSCGCGRIYDGTFTGRLVSGDGFFTKLLMEKGIAVTTEKEVLVW